MNLVREVVLALTIFVLLILWPTAAKADDLGGYLGGVFLKDPASGVTVLKGKDDKPLYFTKMSDCVDAAVRINQNSPWLRQPEQRERGAEVVCLPIVRGSV